MPKLEFKLNSENDREIEYILNKHIDKYKKNHEEYIEKRYYSVRGSLRDQSNIVGGDVYND